MDKDSQDFESNEMMRNEFHILEARSRLSAKAVSDQQLLIAELEHELEISQEEIVELGKNQRVLESDNENLRAIITTQIHIEGLKRPEIAEVEFLQSQWDQEQARLLNRILSLEQEIESSKGSNRKLQQDLYQKTNGMPDRAQYLEILADYSLKQGENRSLKEVLESRNQDIHLTNKLNVELVIKTK